MVVEKLNRNYNSIGVIYGFYLSFNYVSREEQVKYLKEEFSIRQKELISKGFRLGTLIITKSQANSMPELLALIKQEGWEEVASSTNPVHSHQTYCHLFVKDLTTKNKYKVLNLKKFEYDNYKIRSWILTRWNNWKKVNGKLRI